MSLMMFDQQERSALILTDTLATTRQLEPAMYSSKVLPLPHLNLAITGTGSSEFNWLWEDFVTRQMIGTRDIDDVNMVAPAALRDLWADVKEQIDGDRRSRICTLGFPSGSDTIVRYTYESENDFEPEKFEGSALWVQPLPQTFEIEFYPEQREDFIALAIRIRDEQDQGEVPDPVGIGGDLHATLVENWSIHTARWHRFADHESTRQAMVSRAKKENEPAESAA